MIDAIYLISRLAIGFSCIVISLHLILFYYKQQEIYFFKNQVFLWAGFIFLFGVNNMISFWVIPVYITVSLYFTTGIITTIAAVMFPVSVAGYLKRQTEETRVASKELDSFTYRMTLMRAAYKKEKDKRKFLESLTQEIGTINNLSIYQDSRLKTIIAELLQIKEDIINSGS